MLPRIKKVMKMTKAYYTQQANEIFPIYGVSSIEEARQFVSEGDWSTIVETAEDVYMNIETGSVDFESGWDDQDIESGSVVKVEYSVDQEAWFEA